MEKHKGKVPGSWKVSGPGQKLLLAVSPDINLFKIYQSKPAESAYKFISSVKCPSRYGIVTKFTVIAVINQWTFFYFIWTAEINTTASESTVLT